MAFEVRAHEAEQCRGFRADLVFPDSTPRTTGTAAHSIKEDSESFNV